MSAYKAFNCEEKLFTHVCGYTLDINQLAKLHCDEYLDSVFRLVGRMKKLKLTVEEECVLKGIIILSRGSKLVLRKG